VAFKLGQWATPDSGPAGSDQLERLRHHFTRAIQHFNSQGAHNALDGLFASFSIERALSGAVMPALADLREHQASGATSGAEEHFAAGLLLARLLALASGWEHGHGPRACWRGRRTSSTRCG
jgi:hypothetical protein